MALTNEDLLAISQLLDVKFKAENQTVKNEIQTLRSELQLEIRSVKSELQGEIQAVKAELQGEIQAVKAELHEEIQAVKAELHEEIQAVKAELQGEINELRGEIQTVKSDIRELQTEVHKIKLFQENIIMPRLNTIESCYTSTYNKYKDSVEQFEAMQADNEVMKQVLMEHSEKLKRLA